MKGPILKFIKTCNQVFKVAMNIFPEIINETFDFSKNSTYELSCGNWLARLNILDILRSSPLQAPRLKYVIKYLMKSKKQLP